MAKGSKSGIKCSPMSKKGMGGKSMRGGRY